MSTAEAIIGRTALFCAALSLLHAASGEDSAEVARLLLAEGRIYDVNHLDKRGDSPLMIAVHEKRVKTVRELAAHPSVDLDTRDRWDRSVEEVARCKYTNTQKKTKRQVHPKEIQRQIHTKNTDGTGVWRRWPGNANIFVVFECLDFNL